MIMNVDRSLMTQRILDLTLEIINLLTEEEYIVVKIPGGRVPNRKCHVSDGYGRTQSSTTEPPPHSPTHEGHTNQKILELTHRILRLLTGEVPIRCEDVAVYLSMEEWKYAERHKDLYKDVMMEDHQPVITADNSVSGEPLAPVSLPDFGTENFTNNGETCVKNNTAAKGRAESSTSTEREPLGIEDSPVTEVDLNPTTEHPQTGYTSPDIEEEPTSCERGNLTDRDVYKPTGHTQTQHTSTNIKVESDSGEGDIHPSAEHTQTEEPSTGIKKETPTCEEIHLTDGVLHKPSEHPRTVYTPAFPEECLNTLDIYCSESIIESRKPDRSIYQGDTMPVIIINTDLIIHNLVKAEDSATCPETGKVSLSESGSVIRDTNCKGSSTSDRGNVTHASDDLKIPKVHAEGLPFPCSELEERLTDGEGLDAAQTIHTGERLFKCSECENCFTSQCELVVHQETHTREKRFKCFKCGKCFVHASCLALHRLTHVGEKSFKCPDCGKCFAWPAQLDSHKLVHSGEKPYSCSECDKCFSLKSSLNKHLKSHTGEKPFKCNECEKRFTHLSDFASHRIIHTGEKPFNCTECGKCFSRKGNLNRHMKGHTKRIFVYDGGL